MTVTGKSMQPFIRNNDVVILEPAGADSIVVGDVVLARRADGAYVLHRVVRIHAKDYYLAGDAQRDVEGPLSRENIIARVRTVLRRSREIHLDRGFQLLAALLWIRTVPIGPLIVAWTGRLRHGIRRTPCPAAKGRTPDRSKLHV